MIYKVRVTPLGNDPLGEETLQEIRATLGISSVSQVRTKKVYRLEGVSHEQAQMLAQRVLCDRLTQRFELVNGQPSADAAACHIEVGFKPGVMNPEAASILKAAHDCGITELAAADSSKEYHFDGSLTNEELALIIKRLLVNETVEHVVTTEPETLLIESRPGDVRIVPVTGLSNEELLTLSQERSLFLNLEEMQVIKEYFASINREPTDAELETLAQTWSEHCGHKTCHARLVQDGKEIAPLIERLMNKAREYMGDVISAFEDNSGVIHFYDGWGLCGKVETHNKPSSLEPYGGANTGTGGVIRDPAGTGQGGKVIVSTDMFCFAPCDLPLEALPEGSLHPRYLLRKVVAGVRDYGNRMGIPTNQGSVHFHPDFRANPTVIVGAYAIIPVDRARKGKPQNGDVIILVGGRTGRDGIHGATFSSGESTQQTATVHQQAVQIGNAIEEKRTLDALLVCRDADLIVAVTDCGAGGLASAVGEMGSKTGAEVWLEKVPVKYPGLHKYEIWISESQERMVLAVRPENVRRAVQIFNEHNVEATVIGYFTDDHWLNVKYRDESVCSLSMEFLHHGLPQRVMKIREPQRPRVERSAIEAPKDAAAWRRVYNAVMAHGNVCSKEPIVRTYDHTVQGTSALPPFSGVRHDGPNDAVVIRPLLDKPYGLVISHGLNPILNRIDPYQGSLWAAVEALANYTAVGGNFRTAALIDNFIWPFPDEESLWDLNQSFEACIKIMDVFGIPFVSGKDSLSSTYRKGNFVLKIPPVLCVSVFGKISNVRDTVTADFKQAGSAIVLVGKPDTLRLGGSVYYDIHNEVGDRVPQVNLRMLPKLFDWLYREIAWGHVLSCHDISEGGMAAALAEMCFGGELGANLDVLSDTERLDHWFFNETAGCFLLEVSRDRVYELIHSANMLGLGSHVLEVGKVTDSSAIAVNYYDQSPLFTVAVEELRQSWQKPMKEIFH